MTKRLISLMLAVLMMLAVFTSCADNGDAVENTVDEASRYTSTINMWLITESADVQKASEYLANGYDPDDFVGTKLEERTDTEKAEVAKLSAAQKLAWEQLDDISEELNKITKKQFKTQVILRCVTEDGYYETVEKAFADYKQELENGGMSSEEMLQKEETVLNEYGIPELKYPKASAAQVDILFVGDIVKYRQYAESGDIAPLTEMIENSAVKLSYYISSLLLSSAMYNGEVYGVPNNHTIGEYTYIAVDEKLANEYLTTPERLENSVFSSEAYRLLEYVYEASQGEADPEKKVYPIYSETGTIDLSMLHYWTFNPDSPNATYIQSPETFSLFGGFYTASDAQGSLVRCTNLLTSQEYATNLQRKLRYENTPGYITDNPDHASAVRIVKGDYTMQEVLEGQGYKVFVAEQPRVTDNDVFSSMFAVGANTRDQERAMEIITYLNTNSELRNLLQYGIEGKNYELVTVLDEKQKPMVDENGKPLVYAQALPDNTYVMDITKTGNMFVAYPNAKESNVAEGKYGVTHWAIGKLQNLDAATYPTVGLYFSREKYVANESGFKVNDESVRVLNAVSEAIKTQVLDLLTTPEQVSALRNEALDYIVDHNGMANFLLNDLLGGTVGYLKADGKPALVKVEQLATALSGMANSYTESTKLGTVQSTNVLYQEWRESNGFKG